ncbi:MAG: HAMP domain-containing histidine kinase [Tissierellia bacterium]|nr:HAMP domain-containing histidine kinase [Tissierellia bacterium]
MCNIHGIISSNYRGTEIKPYEKELQKHFQNNGGVIYIYSKDNEEQTLEHLEEVLEINIREYHKRNRIVFLCREEFIKGDTIDKKAFGDAIKNGLLELDKHGAMKKDVYITIDSFWESTMGKDGTDCYALLENFNCHEDTRFILRYIMEELSEDYINNLIKFHKTLLLDGIEDFEIYTPEELVYKSMTILSRHNLLIYNLEREILRLEYFRTLGELLEGVVHDMNNLLITILGHAQLATMVNSEEDIKKSLEIIQRTTLDGKFTIDAIRNHIRGSTSSLKSMYKFDNIVCTAIEMTEHKFRSHAIGKKGGINLVEELNSNRYIYGNEYELRQSIINIILNGIDAIGDSGSMFIKTYDFGEQTVLEIIDSGHGMAETTMKKLFSPYFSTKGNKGTGLGLNIAKKIFDNHGAEVMVESKINKGTKFTISFPTELFASNVAEGDIEDYNIT